MQLVPITTKVVNLNPVHGEVYSIQHYVIKFDIDLQQVCGFFMISVLVSSTSKTEHHINEILVKVDKHS